MKSNLRLFLIFFAYTCVAALSVQLFILPILAPQLHGGHGLLARTDAVVFHEVAVDISNDIKTRGWSHFELGRNEQNRGIASEIAAIFYTLTVPEPYVLIPINALVHALSALLLVLIFQECIGKSPQAYYGALPFLLLPSAASWYAQIHRDGYCFLGFFFLLHAWVKLSNAFRWKNIFTGCLVVFIEGALGCVLINASRWYILEIVSTLLPLIAVFLIAKNIYDWNRDRRAWPRLILSIGVCVVALLVPRVFAQKAMVRSAVTTGSDPLQTSEFKKADTQWKRSGLPEKIELKLFGLSRQRDDFKQEGYRVNGSDIDSKISFRSAVDFVRYLPRALQISFFAPFPNQWFSKGVKQAGLMMRTVSAFEMIIVYVGLVFLLLQLPTQTRTPAFWVLSVLCVGVMLVYAYTINNLGALYRYRYGYLMPLVGLGFAKMDLKSYAVGIRAIFSRITPTQQAMLQE